MSRHNSRSRLDTVEEETAPVGQPAPATTRHHRVAPSPPPQVITRLPTPQHNKPPPPIPSRQGSLPAPYKRSTSLPTLPDITMEQPSSAPAAAGTLPTVVYLQNEEITTKYLKLENNYGNLRQIAKKGCYMSTCNMRRLCNRGSGWLQYTYTCIQCSTMCVYSLIPNYYIALSEFDGIRRDHEDKLMKVCVHWWYYEMRFIGAYHVWNCLLSFILTRSSLLQQLYIFTYKHFTFSWMLNAKRDNKQKNN